jgi:hypothetical protein
MHGRPKPELSTPIRFVNAHCPKCHRVTSHLTADLVDGVVQLD